MEALPQLVWLRWMEGAHWSLEAGAAVVLELCGLRPGRSRALVMARSPSLRQVELAAVCCALFCIHCVRTATECRTEVWLTGGLVGLVCTIRSLVWFSASDGQCTPEQ